MKNKAFLYFYQKKDPKAVLANKNNKFLLGILSLSLWILLIVLILYEHYQEGILHVKPQIPAYWRAILLNLSLFFAYFYLDTRNELDKSIELGNIFRDLFLVGVLSTLASLAINLLMHQLLNIGEDWAILLSNFWYHVELAILFFFLEYSLLKWKKLILQQKSAWINSTWQVFEYLLLASLLFHFWDGNGTSFYYLYPLAIFILLTLVLSVSLSWVAFLTFKEKVKSLFFLLILLSCFWYFSMTISQYKGINPIGIDLSESIFLNALRAFTGFYALSSALVLLFNLPTSSVFEQKFDDLVNYHKVSETILEGQNATQVYETLLESAVETLKADAVWIETSHLDEIICKNIDLENAQQVLKGMENAQESKKNFANFEKKDLHKFAPDFAYNSLLVVPFFSHKDEWIATMFIAKKLSHAFDNVTINLIKSYSAQAEVALDNLRLVAETVENERFKGEMMTAKKVQKRLLPKLHIDNEKVQILAYSFSPDIVGGDYYDFYRIEEQKYALIIGDVAGKGTSAAFNMAQMKGIFHTLVQLDLSPDMFMKFANHALANCLEKSSFVTASYFTMDLPKQKLYFSRAGHCPTLFYSKAQNRAFYLESKGLGLGIIRSAKYENFIDVQSLTYQSGDVMLLYTDGIVEAKSCNSDEEFGYDKLKVFMEKYAQDSPEEITANLVKEVIDFAGKNISKDDYTILLVKFL